MQVPTPRKDDDGVEVELHVAWEEGLRVGLQLESDHSVDLLNGVCSVRVGQGGESGTSHESPAQTGTASREAGRSQDLCI